jgi:hypothetical protein
MEQRNVELLHGTETHGIVAWKRETWNICIEKTQEITTQNRDT